MEKMLSGCLLPTNKMIKALIDIELGYINTNHPDFISDTQKLLQDGDNKSDSEDEEKSENQD